MGKRKPYRITIIAPTCFYYQAPLFRAIAANPLLDLLVYYCSDEGISGKDVKLVYGVDESCGTEHALLQGYESKILKNHSPWGSYLKSLVGLANFGIWQELNHNRPDVVVIMSWMNPTWWLTILACLRFRIPMMYMTDANVSAERLNRGWKSWIKRKVLRNLLFPVITGFLCSGTANRQLYTYYGVPENKLFPFAYSWGYDHFIEESKYLKNRKAELRRNYGLPHDAVVILYCGRFSSEKGSINLIEAYGLVAHSKKALVLVGDGRLRSPMEELVNRQGMRSVYFMGYKRREAIGRLYALADIFVLPSRKETWGMVVNEALCFSLPMIVSDQVGAGMDLVIPHENGYIFPAGDVAALADGISKLADLTDDDRLRMGTKSLGLIQKWMDRDLGKTLVESLESVAPMRRGPVSKLMSACYVGLPEIMVRCGVFFIIGLVWVIGGLFLAFKIPHKKEWTDPAT